MRLQKVRDIMTADPVTVTSGTSLKYVAEFLPSRTPGSTWTTPSSPSNASWPSVTTTRAYPARLISWI